jgi:hypothetical protein
MQCKDRNQRLGWSCNQMMGDSKGLLIALAPRLPLLPQIMKELIGSCFKATRHQGSLSTDFDHRSPSNLPIPQLSNKVVKVM